MTNETTNSVRKYPLANDVHGSPLEVPTEAVAWRVRRLARKAGRPKVLFDAETGAPLELALAVTFEDFAESVGESGRYRLEPVDAQGRIVPGCVAVTEVVFEEDESNESSPPRNAGEAMPELVRLIGQLVESNAQVMKAMASAFGQVQPTAPPIMVEAPAAKQAADGGQLLGLLTGLMQQFSAKPSAATAAEGVS